MNNLMIDGKKSAAESSYNAMTRVEDKHQAAPIRGFHEPFGQQSNPRRVRSAARRWCHLSGARPKVAPQSVVKPCIRWLIKRLARPQREHDLEERPGRELLECSQQPWFCR